ncbi:SixA phosphatase family protein [Profundibacterium mesophilum]|uniref:Glucosamine--fructose-6-phosphate aminotransferase n=1 Tax=Profundibacterium mesophilum KAUST100406-0324 TaxID=1037889 RepID=A0A921TDG7_9RHOB|nr:histidine phosphatase family protein [Profundibacterium mesophilum]KAF0676182.1 glucosamine--fructose-6-phosphate aminotransferase [Profundibacterium mesophilum KAUST100406-0324]
MPLRLGLMRHGEAEAAPLGQDDASRALTPRGTADVRATARWLVAEGHLPGRLLVSSARRTAQTCDAVCSILQTAPERLDLPDLYLAAASEILSAIAGQPAASLLVIGHNPGISMLAERLASARGSTDGLGSFEPGSVMMFECDLSSWSDLSAENASVIGTFSP